jgi:hypothetical protein
MDMNYAKIRKKDDQVKVCFLTVSERYKEEHIPGFLSSGSSGCFLIKPITIDDLVNRVVSCILRFKPYFCTVH